MITVTIMVQSSGQPPRTVTPGHDLKVLEPDLVASAAILSPGMLGCFVGLSGTLSRMSFSFSACHAATMFCSLRCSLLFTYMFCSLFWLSRIQAMLARCISFLVESCPMVNTSQTDSTKSKGPRDCFLRMQQEVLSVWKLLRRYCKFKRPGPR